MDVKTGAAVLPLFGEAAGMISNGAGIWEQSLSFRVVRIRLWEPGAVHQGNFKSLHFRGCYFINSRYVITSACRGQMLYTQFPAGLHPVYVRCTPILRHLVIERRIAEKWERWLLERCKVLSNPEEVFLQDCWNDASVPYGFFLLLNWKRKTMKPGAFLTCLSRQLHQWHSNWWTLPCGSVV